MPKTDPPNYDNAVVAIGHILTTDFPNYQLKYNKNKYPSKSPNGLIWIYTASSLPVN